MSDKTIDEYFCDWESHVFGYGYGTGEEHIFSGLKRIMATIPETDQYDYREFEESVGHLSAWLFINILCKHDIFEYGTSSRFGWLTDSGKVLKKYLEETAEFKEFDENYSYCYPDCCNCDDGQCKNPFWS